MIPIFNLKTIREKITYSYFSPPIMPQPKKQGFWRSISNINDASLLTIEIEEDRELDEQIFELRNCILFPIIEPSTDHEAYEVYDIKSTPSEIFSIEGTYDSNDDWIPKSLYLDSRFLVSMNPQQLSYNDDHWNWISIGNFYQYIPRIRDGRNNLYFFINLTNYDDFLRLNKLGKSLVTFLLGNNPKFFNPEASGELEIVEEEE